jgi:hypothetical protein
MKETYYVTCRVGRYYRMKVEAGSIEEAMESVDREFDNFNFGDLGFAEHDITRVDDSQNKCIWGREEA